MASKPFVYHGIISQVKRQPTEWGLFSSHVSEKRVISNIYRDIQQSIAKHLNSIKNKEHEYTFTKMQT